MSVKTGQPSIVDDFMYGSNVATAHVSIRLGFLRKVYGIVTAQLLLTTLISLCCYINEDFNFFIDKNPWIMLVAFIGTLGTLFALMVKRQETPTNYILLAVFTALESLTVGVVVARYDKMVVIEALALTMGVTVALTVYTLQSKRDFSSWGAGLFSCLWVLILVMLIQIIIPLDIMDRAISAGGAILFSLFIVFDTHMMMHKLSAEEYIMAAINLYLDILNLFLHILRLLGDRKN
ncbi:protein lifeguard 4-like [Mercenaria mercenaria]|uniref:protein lifeguard 4-like n=1 Tax=Mercenaria mercenaria TaxID=6596 RepID=UPI001E1DD47F|nr:protein lifeguard 4-like [Mercenaria mercenaria]XP_045166927.1 protein lifeguard 4-like [Mercenaria mercenaria]XP_045166928.1 protein lifeguard 4-like [Mercenaria mercenaria]